MRTECPQQLTFWKIGKQEVSASPDGGRVVSDAGLLPLRNFERRLGLLADLAERLPDPRAQTFVTHTQEAILTQQIYQILAGYPDCNDAQALRQDPLFQTLADVSPDQGRSLASCSTLNRHQYAYTAEAVTPVTLCRFPRGRLERLFDAYPKVEKRLLAIASDELAAAQDQILLLGRKTADERIASFLLRLAATDDDASEAVVTLPMSRLDIADHLGLTIETVSRTLSRFKRDGLIDLVSRHEIALRDMDRIRALAEGECAAGI